MRRVNRQMNIIAAVDANWAIGYKNELLVKIPNDQKWFQKITTGKVVVMGRKTMETFPNGMPLKNRTNIVLTGDRALRVKDAELVYGIEELLPYCDTAYITKIDYTYQADRYFPNLDNDADWHIESESEEQTYFDLEYYFVKYVRG